MPQERSLVDILAIARKRWRWVAAPLVLLVALSWWYTDRQPPRYEATARVLLAEDASTRVLDPGSQNPGFLAREIENQIALAYGSEVETRLVEQLGHLPELSVSHSPESDVLLFQADGSTAVAAADAANTWAAVFVTVRQDRDRASIATAMAGLEERLDALQEERDLIRAPLDSLRRRIRAATDPADALRLQQDYDLLADEFRYQLDLNNSDAQATVADLSRLRLQADLAAATQDQIAEPAQIPDGPANTPLSRILVIAVLAGAIFGVALAVLVDAKDTTFHTAEDLQAIGLPVLATVPRARRPARPSIGLTTAEHPNGPLADAFHQLRSSLEFEMHDQPIRSVMVTSPNAGEGRSTVAANLALALGSVGARTVLADGDYRAGAQHTIFGIDRRPGMSDLVRRKIEAPQATHTVPGDETEDIAILPTGAVPPNPAAFVASPRFLGTLRWMTTQADMIVLDTPPLLGVPESHTLARYVDGVIVVVRARATTAEDLRSALTILDQVRARVVGAVLVGAKPEWTPVRQQVRVRQRHSRQLAPPVLETEDHLRTADLATYETILHQDSSVVADLGHRPAAIGTGPDDNNEGTGPATQNGINTQNGSNTENGSNTQNDINTENGIGVQRDTAPHSDDHAATDDPSPVDPAHTVTHNGSHLNGMHFSGVGEEEPDHAESGSAEAFGAATTEIAIGDLQQPPIGHNETNAADPTDQSGAHQNRANGGTNGTGPDPNHHTDDNQDHHSGNGSESDEIGFGEAVVDLAELDDATG